MPTPKGSMSADSITAKKARREKMWRNAIVTSGCIRQVMGSTISGGH